MKDQPSPLRWRCCRCGKTKIGPGAYGDFGDTRFYRCHTITCEGMQKFEMMAPQQAQPKKSDADLNNEARLRRKVPIGTTLKAYRNRNDHYTDARY